MTAILQNAVTTKRVTATATDENYKYNVAYEVGDNGKTLNNVAINAQEKDGKYASRKHLFHLRIFVVMV